MTDPITRLERVFSAVLDAARADPDLAQALADALDGRASRSVARSPRAGAPPRPEPSAPRLDPIAVMRAEGGDGLRARLAGLKRGELLEAAKAIDEGTKGLSSFTKPRLIEHIVSVARRRTTRRRSPLDYRA